MDVNIEGNKTLNRLLKNTDLSGLSKKEREIFESRLHANFPSLFSLLLSVYGHHYDFYFHLQQLLSVLLNGYVSRKNTLKKKDQKRINQPNWFASENTLGIACYVDLFSTDLKNLKNKIPYLESLGITYLHLMPLYKSPEGDSDGGYAVSDYRQVDSSLGDINDLSSLTDALAEKGISLVLDFVFNHTSNEHEWAIKAQEGQKEFQDYYWMFDNKEMPDRYEENLREIFPQVRRGNFSFNENSGKWVWTTFNNFQWDLNYANPAVFSAITDEMLFLANIGCDVLRLDALAFIWKELGTSCENQPKAHSLIQAFNCCLKIVSPSVVFKSEAIVHPDEVIKYISPAECELSYNPLLMALIWNSLATRKTKLLTRSMQKSFAIPAQCQWVNYARCHDDIGWTFDDDVASSLGINSYDHRQFLNQFYTGRHEGSFAKGVVFAENSETGDCRVCGSLASLAGLEQAIEINDSQMIENAIKRILLIHSIILSIGGVPLLYSGDEIGLLNDYEYVQDPAKENDGRWVHRIALRDSDIERSRLALSPFNDISTGLEHLIRIRKSNPIFGAAKTEFLSLGNDHIFAYRRHVNQCDLHNSQPSLIVMCNFSEFSQCLAGIPSILNESAHILDLITKEEINYSAAHLVLAPYQTLWLLCT